MKVVAVILCFLFVTSGYCQPYKLSRFFSPVRHDTTLKLLTYGMGVRWDKEQSMSAIEKKYGFRRFSVAGCLVSKELVDSVNKHNDSIIRLLQERHGKDWKYRFNAEVDALHKKEVKAIQLVKDYMVAHNTTIKDLSTLDFLIEETANQHQVRLICFRELFTPRVRTIAYFAAIVDLHSKSVALEEQFNMEFDGIAFYH